MFLLYNGHFFPEEEVRLPLTNRAFQYNDGYFETIMLHNGKLRLWEEHQARIKEAAVVLQINLGELLEENGFQKQVKLLTEKNDCGALARIKLKVWRAGQGLYTPQTDHAEWLVTAQPAQSPPEEPLHTGICQTVRTIPSVFSSFKGVNSPVYVLASREKSTRHLDDLIILDPLGYVAELTHSNIFWIKDRTLYTPALGTGCLHGVMRRKLVKWAKGNGWTVQEGFFDSAEILDAEMVFAGNVTGLRPISAIENNSLPQNPETLRILREGVFL